MKKILKPLAHNQSLKGECQVPPDKSIAQRSVILAGIAKGESIINNFPMAGDPQSTLSIMEKLGLEIEKNQNTLKIKGQGIQGLKEPSQILDCGNSGTGFRLIMGLMAGHPAGFFSVLSGDQSLSKRPMKRVTEPLKSLGAQIWGRENASKAPICIIGKSLNGGSIKTAVASAQLKSALLLAGLNAQAPLIITEPVASRNHTEIMLQSFGANFKQVDELTVQISPNSLKATEINIPGDFSSAAFLIAAALIIPNSELTIKQIGLNPTRIGFLEVVKKMGANLQVDYNQQSPDQEPIGNITVKSSNLKAVCLEGSLIANIIDEIPIISLLAARAEGITEIKNAEELRVKESDRLKVMFEVLTGLGVKVSEKPDGLIIEGQPDKPFESKQKTFEAYHDHRIAMTIKIASLICLNEIVLNGSEWASVSFPSFYDLLDNLTK